MQEGIPEVTVESTPYQSLTNLTGGQIFATCVESTKGEPNFPVLITSAQQAYQEFKTREFDSYFMVGGQGLYLNRVVIGTAIAASHDLYDNAATGVKALTLTNKKKGTYPTYVTAAPNTSGGSNLIIEEAGFNTEYYLGVATIADLAARIASESNIVTPTFVAEGTGILAAIARIQIGTGFTVGSNGTDADTDGKFTDEAKAATAHRNGLAYYENIALRGVVTTSAYEAVRDEYVLHANDMSAQDSHQWRYAVIGATNNTSKGDMLTETAKYNSQNVMYVGQGLIDRNGNDHYPCQATLAVAGKRSQLEYNVPIWGGESRKRLGTGGENYFVEALPIVNNSTLTTKLDLIEYNEKGVITFVRDLDGVRIREAVMTTQPGNQTDESSESVMSIINEVKKNIYDAAFAMLGRPITASYKTDLEEAIKSKLEYMKVTDMSLIDADDEGLKAYDVVASIVPRTNQRLGKVTVSATVTPVHAARKINASVVIM
jgi:hypothetical protein